MIVTFLIFRRCSGQSQSVVIGNSYSVIAVGYAGDHNDV